MSPRYVCAALMLAALALAPAALAQPEAPRWGRIPEEDLAMTAFPADSAAAALVLADVGSVEFEISDGLPAVVFRRHRRVKVLTEAGYAYGNVVLSFDAEAGERIREVRGQTFVPGAGGRPRRVELERDAVHEGDAGDGFRDVRFALPALEPGAVFEFSYELATPDVVVLPRWYFQDRVPVRYSAFTVTLPGFLGYTGVQEGTHPLEEGSGTQMSLTFGRAQMHWWVGRDLPALPEEPYVDRVEDYLRQLQMQLQTVLDPQFGFSDGVLQTWPEVATALQDDPAFGERLRNSRGVRERAAALTSDGGTAIERVRRLHDFVRTTVVWDGTYRAFPGRDPADVLAASAGSSADVNFLLGALLREAGFEATPVLISTRSHGRSLPLYPLLSQFNHVLVLTTADGLPLLLDATDPTLHLGVLPEEMLSGMGWKVDPAGAEWISFQPYDRSNTTAHVSATLSEAGALEGLLTLRLSGYHAAGARRTLRAQAAAPAGAATAAATEAAEGREGLEILEVTVANADSVFQPLELRARFRLEAAAEQIGDRLYLTPVLFGRVAENPFRLAERTYPVNFGYPSSVNYSAEITLPEGWEVEEAPAAAGHAVRGGGARYSRGVTPSGSAVVVQARFQLAQPAFGSAEYGALRAFFDDVVAAEAEPVVLRRAGAASAGEAAPGVDRP